MIRKPINEQLAQTPEIIPKTDPEISDLSNFYNFLLIFKNVIDLSETTDR